MSFNKWLDVFIEEKELAIGHAFEFEDGNGYNLMPLEVVIEYLKNQSNDIKNKVKSKIVEIDFLNGNVMNFFEYVAKGIPKFIN